MSLTTQKNLPLKMFIDLLKYRRVTDVICFFFSIIDRVNAMLTAICTCVFVIL